MSANRVDNEYAKVKRVDNSLCSKLPSRLLKPLHSIFAETNAGLEFFDVKELHYSCFRYLWAFSKVLFSWYNFQPR